MSPIGTTWRLDDSLGAIRVEQWYDTDIDDLWEACTSPERLARWLAEVSGDLREGGTVHAVFTSTWSGPLIVEVCDPPHRLLLREGPGTEEAQIEAWLTADGPRTRLVVEQRGLPLDGLRAHGAGWHAHLDDLGRSLTIDGPVHVHGWSAEAPAPAWRARWNELAPSYGDEPAPR